MANVFKALSRLVIGGIALTLVPGLSQGAEPPPVAAYGKLPDIERMALSNDGSRIAVVMSIKGERVVVLMTSDFKTLRMMRLEDQKVRSMDWVGPDSLIVRTSRTEILGPEYINDKVEFSHAIVLPSDPAKDFSVVFEKDPAMLNGIFGEEGTRYVDGHWLVYFAGVQKEHGTSRAVGDYHIPNGGPSLFAVDPVTGHRQRVAAPASPDDASQWLLGPDGNVAATLVAEALLYETYPSETRRSV
jgi:hypothetical protein